MYSDGVYRGIPSIGSHQMLFHLFLPEIVCLKIPKHPFNYLPTLEIHFTQNDKKKLYGICTLGTNL